MMEKWLPGSDTDPRLKMVEENLKEIRFHMGEAAIRSGRRPEDITLLAVTKTVSPALINHAIACGVDKIGENRVQEFLSKKTDLHLNGIGVHLIGALQTNKVRKIVGEVEMIQSVDRMHLAQEISRISVEKGLTTNCLIEVNIGEEQSKSGVSRQEAMELVEKMAELPGIRVQGLMSIPPICETNAQVRQYFSNMNQLFLDIKAKKIDNVCMKYLSMGMSADYQEAILEGSNLIRPGTALFGLRKK
nr:YggS family pyridoxal phosphate-dependent enzyme [uncultured Solibaculum sp.]